MLMLPPAENTVANCEFRADLKNLSQAIANERTLGRIVDVRLHHKRVGSNISDGVWIDLMSFRHDQATDLVDRFRFQAGR